MPGIPNKIANKYAKLLASDVIRRIRMDNGTMPINVRAMQAVIAAKFADRRLMTSLVNEYANAGTINVKL